MWTMRNACARRDDLSNSLGDYFQGEGYAKAALLYNGNWSVRATLYPLTGSTYEFINKGSKLAA